MELSKGGNVYPMPQQPSSQNTELQPKPLAQRHEVYTDMLSLLTLSPKHRENLRERGLSDNRIDRNQYRSMPQTPEGRKLLASLLRSTGHDLQGIPGFRTSYGEWTLSGALGHYDAGFTLSTYTHATEGMKRSAADTIGSVISQAM